MFTDAEKNMLKEALVEISHWIDEDENEILESILDKLKITLD